MPGAEISNVGAKWSSGALYLTDPNGSTLASIANSTGLVFYSGQALSTITTATTLTRTGHMGTIVKCSVDATFLTLPVASTTSLPGTTFTVMNTASDGGAQIILITATGDSIIGAGISTSNLYSNTKTTAKKGDSLTVIATGSSTWYAIGMTGTWASTT